MAVVVSQAQNEIDDLRRLGLDIRPHRRRILEEALDVKFKDPADPLRIVFVCAMWMTGFDAPSVSTIYLDKPMRNHTLMQAIARANRVFAQKVNGLIVDYIGVFRDLQRALAIYGSGGEAGGAQGGDLPVETKLALVADLEAALDEARQFLAAHGVQLDAFQHADGFALAGLISDAANALLVNDETKNHYLNLAGRVDLLFQAILPDLSANRFGVPHKAIVVIAQALRAETDAVDISQAASAVGSLLDESILPAGAGYVIEEAPAGERWLDLSQVDFETLQQRFAASRKHLEIARLRARLNAHLQRLLRLNKSRLDYYQHFQRLIAEYNAGAKNADAMFAELLSFARRLSEEEQRSVSEQLSEEELALFDLLTRPQVKLSRAERQQVKDVARQLLDTLKAERLVLDWRKRQQTRAAVQEAIAEWLDRLPEVYDAPLYQEKCALVYQHMYDAYAGGDRSIYAR